MLLARPTRLKRRLGEGAVKVDAGRCVVINVCRPNLETIGIDVQRTKAAFGIAKVWVQLSRRYIVRISGCV